MFTLKRVQSVSLFCRFLLKGRGKGSSLLQELDIHVSLYQALRLPYRTKVFIGINVREIRDCQNRERFKPTKTNFQQALDA